jgi:hypothetical protein
LIESLGRTVVAFALVLWPLTASAQWRTTSLPVLDIAGTDSSDNVLLELPSGGTRLSDGTVVVADGPAGRIRFFGADGKLLRTVGRSGRGPGEFVAISWLGQCGRDSVFAWDFVQQRLSAITAAGEIVRQVRMPTDPTKAPPPFSLACSRSGLLALLGWPAQSGPTSDQFTRGSAPLTLATTAGDVIRRVGDVAGTEFVTLQCGGAAPRPLGKSTFIALSRDFVFVGTGDSASVDVYLIQDVRAGGIPAKATVKVATVRRAPTRRELEAAVDPLVAYFPAGDMRDKMRGCLLSVPAPDQAPPYAGVFVDSVGTLWIQTSLAGDPDTHLLAMSPTGQRLGELVLPRALTIFEIGTDYVLGRYDATSGEPHVALYRYTHTR